MSTLTNAERTALVAALAGSESWQKCLLQQINSLEVESRDDTGAGVYTNFRTQPGEEACHVPASVERDPPTVWADHPDLEGPVAFLVWIKQGKIKVLEMALSLGRTPISNEDAFVFKR